MLNRSAIFWVAAGLGMASSIIASVCFTVAYYEGRQLVRLDDLQALFAALPSGNVEARLEIAGTDNSDLPWWIAGAVCAALAVACLTFAVVRRPRRF